MEGRRAGRKGGEWASYLLFFAGRSGRAPPLGFEAKWTALYAEFQRNCEGSRGVTRCAVRDKTQRARGPK